MKWKSKIFLGVFVESVTMFTKLLKKIRNFVNFSALLQLS